MSRLAMLKLRSHDICDKIYHAERTIKSPHVSKTTKVMLKNKVKVWKQVLLDIDTKIDEILFGAN